MKKKIALVFLFLLVSVIGAGLVYGYNTLYQINEIVSEPKLEESELNINYDLDIDTVNIAVFGIDGRSDVEGDRSDTIMIVSLDFRSGTVKVTSIMRDLLAYIPETDDKYESLEKINAAYAYGGPELAIKTLNENFDLNISDYVIVNFDCMVDTVDALGGVEIDIQSEDILEWTNKYIDDVNDKVGKADPKLESTGPQTVTGVQALAYARNRYSDDDFHRTARQREVVKAIVDKAFDMDIVTGVSLLSKIYPYVQTTLNISEITSYAKAFLTAEDRAFYEFRVPTDANVYTDMIGGISYVIPNTLYDNVIALHDFIYGPIVEKTETTETTTLDDTTATGETTDNPGNITSNRVNSNLNSSSSTSGNVSSSNSSGYTSYVPSERVKEISDSIESYANSGYYSSSSNDSDDDYYYEDDSDNDYSDDSSDDSDNDYSNDYYDDSSDDYYDNSADEDYSDDSSYDAPIDSEPYDDSIGTEDSTDYSTDTEGTDDTDTSE